MTVVRFALMVMVPSHVTAMMDTSLGWTTKPASVRSFVSLKSEEF